ncbi:MAG: VWA domain-containing protein [Gammaproteobacteria bacterium]|nr:VWA domain-containing protein [Gammaproteobacteria bacterium]
MNTIAYQQLAANYTAELATIDAELATIFNESVQAIAVDLNEVEFTGWLKAGMQIARNLPDTPQVSINYFRNSKQILHLSDQITVIRCADIALELAHRSPELATSFLQATPFFLLDCKSIDLKTWSDMGSRMCSDSWKSVALAKTFFTLSHHLLERTSTAAFKNLAGVITELSRQSVELATICLQQAAAIFHSLHEDNHLSFLDLAKAMVKNNWVNAWLYFERAPELLRRFQPSESGAFLSLIAAMVNKGCPEPFTLFEEISHALSQIEGIEHGELRHMAQRLVSISPTAAAEFLKSAPFVRERVPRKAMRQWLELGLEKADADIGLKIEAGDKLEAFFRLQSVTADRALALLSGRVEFEQAGNLLRLYGQALAGEKVRVQPISHLVNRGLGWSSETRATTEGTVIYVPPYIDLFGDLNSNLQIFKVCIAHQSGRITFGSFDFQYGEDGTYIKSSVTQRRPVTATKAIVPMQRFFDLFQGRHLIAGLFSLVEDHRIDCCVHSEYPGLRKWLSRVKTHEISQRPRLLELGLRQAFVENLLRASLHHFESIRWPVSLKPMLVSALGALKIVTRPEATIQDTAEIATHLYDLALDIPNIPASSIGDEWIGIEATNLPDEFTRPDVKTMLKATDLTGIAEIDYENPVPPDFYGDLKPELVQTLNALRDNPALEKPTLEQIQAMLENSVEVENVDADTIVEQIEMDTPGIITDATTDEFDAEAEVIPPTDAAEIINWSTYDEWDFRANDYLTAWCQVGERVVVEGKLEYYEETLKRHSGLVRDVRRQFEMMRPESQRLLKNLEDGHEIDLDKAIQFFIDKKAGVGPQARFYSRRDKIERSVAVAFLLDMSGSTDETINDPGTSPQHVSQPGTVSVDADNPGKKIIDLEKESTVLIIEALEAIGDTYGIYGFSGYGRQDVSFHVIKEFDQILDDTVKKRIDSIKPLRSTRMGAAIRHTNSKLLDCPAKVKILMLISDGRPQDHGYGDNRGDHEYAIRDTKQALIESKQEGIVPFLITVDKEGHDYLKEICGDIGYEVVADIESLPHRLPTIYKYLATKA